MTRLSRSKQTHRLSTLHVAREPDEAPGYTASPARRLLRFRVWLNALELDHRIADGSPPSDSPQLELRVLQLASARTRWDLARGLTDVVAHSQQPVETPMAVTPLRRSAVLAADGALLELAAALTHPSFNNVRGVALASCLLRDPSSPLHGPTGRRLSVAAHAATAALRATT